MPPKKVVKPKKVDSDDEAFPTRDRKKMINLILKSSTKSINCSAEVKKASPGPVEPKTTDKKKPTNAI